MPFVYQVTTPPCLYCNESSTVEITPFEYQRLKDGVDIQSVFPKKSADERELLITGTHPWCWDKLFPGFETEDEPPF